MISSTIEKTYFPSNSSFERVILANTEEKFETFVHLAKALTGFSSALIILIKEDNSIFTYCFDCDYYPSETIEKLAEKIIHSNIDFYETDHFSKEWDHASLFFLSGETPESLVVLPIEFPKDYRVGAICLFDFDSKTISESTQEHLRLLATQSINLIIQQATLEEQAKIIEEQTDATESAHQLVQKLQISNKRLDLVNLANSEYIYEFDPITKDLQLSPKFEILLGITPKCKGENYRLIQSIRPNNPKLKEKFEHLVYRTKESSWSESYSFKKDTGEMAWVKDHAVVIRDEKGIATKVLGSVRDVTESHYFQQIDEIEKNLTSFMIRGQYSFEEVVNQYLKDLELIFPDMKTSIMKVQEGKLYSLAGPSLPEEYMELINGFPIGPDQGSCGSAAYHKTPVIVSDIHQDKRWSQIKQIGANYGFSACWSAPIFNDKTEVVGTFACYYDSIRSPYFYEIFAIERAQRLFNLLFTQFEYLNSIQKNIELFELINQATKDAIYDWDIEKDRLYFGESFTLNFGHEIDSKGTKLEFWKDLIHPADKKRVTEKLNGFLANPHKTKWENEYRMKKLDGSYAQVEAIGTVIRNRAGAPVRLVGVLRDMTEYKSMQYLLEDSNNIAKLGGWELDLEKNKLSWSKTVNEIFDVPLTFMPDPESSLQFYRADYRNKIRNAIRAVILDQQPFNIEAILVTSKGKEKWVRVQGQGEYNGSICLKISGSIQDISDYKYIQMQLEGVSDNIPGVVFQYMLAPDGTDKFLYMSKGSMDLWGLTPQECISDIEKVWDQIMMGGNGAQVKADLQHSAETLSRWHSTWKVIKKDGTIGILEGYGNPQKRADGSVVWDSIILDITEKDKMAHLLQRTKRLARVGSWELFIIGPDQLQMIWSDSLKWVLDYPVNQEVSIGKTLKMLSEKDQATVKRAYQRFISEHVEEPLELEVLIRRDYLNDSIWVKLVLEAEYINGNCIKIYGSAQDIHSQKLDELEIQYQNSLLNSLTEVIGHLFVEENWSEVIDTTFNLIGNTVHVDRIYLFENLDDPQTGKKYAKQTFEWVAPGISPQIDNPALEKIEVDDFMDLFHSLEKNQPLIANVKDIEDPALREMLEFQDIKSLLMFPIFIENEFWGFAGFDECTHEREWRPSEINFLRYFTSNLESSIKRRKDKVDLENLVMEKTRILESLGDGFFVLDKQERVNYWNQAAEKILGVSREEIVGEIIWDRYPNSTAAKFLSYYRDIIQKNSHFKAEEYFPEFGKWLEINAYPSDDTLSVFFKDITERKNFEEAIIQSNERFEIIAKATQDIIWDYDIHQSKLFVSEGFNSQFGYESSKKIHSLQDFIEILHPEDQATVKSQFEASLFGINQDANLSLEYRFLKNDGTYAYIQHRTYFIRDKNGKANRALGAMVDITDRKRYEQSLKQLNLELEEKIKQLDLTNKELEQFAYVTSHDLQEPLRMITSFMTMLESKYSHHLDDKAKLYINFAVDGAKRMRQLILDLLEYSRSGKNESEKEEVDLQDILHQTLLFNKRLMEEKQAQVKFTTLPKALAYRAPLTQVIQNLVENGIKYSKPDTPPRLEVSATDRGRDWLISIQDNGIGIPNEFHERVFIIFQRLHKKEDYKGTGIGLAVVKKQVESWGGKIWLESEPGVGTVFYFTIPK